MEQTAVKESFFTKDRGFYHSFFSLMIIVALQNLVAYSVNMTDNMMLGAYSQDALNGATTVNQIFFMVQQITMSIGEACVTLASQYWGQKRLGPVRRIAGIALKLAFVTGVVTVLICTFMPDQLLHLFTTDASVVAEGKEYLEIIKYTFLLFMLSNVMMAALRAVETVKISFIISVISLILNAGINYILIFGHFGAPRMGIRGAAIGTLVARIVELAIVVFYLVRVDDKLKLFSGGFLKTDPVLRKDYTKIVIPVLISQALWAVSVPVQTAILGHLSSDALAANSVATTFYQYLKVIVVAMSSSSAVMIAKAVGSGKMEDVRSSARTLSVLNILVGVILGMVLLVLRHPLLSIYNMNATALQLADQLIILMCFVMIGMSYQMPVSMGIIRGGGDAKFAARMNMICTWAIVIPLSFMAAFWWKLPVVWVVLVVQSDQLFKCIPVFIKFRKYNWITKLTRKEV